MGVRVRRPNGRFEKAGTNALLFGIQVGREDGIAVVEQEPAGMVQGQALTELLESPFGGGVVYGVGVENPPRSDLHGDEGGEHLHRCGHGNHEFASDDALGVAFQERGSVLIRRPAVQ